MGCSDQECFEMLVTVTQVLGVVNLSNIDAANMMHDVIINKFRGRTILK